MARQKILIATIIILVIINLGTLSFMWFTKSKGAKRHRTDTPQRTEMILERRLKLTESQVEAFKEAREEHFIITAPIMESIHTNRVKLNNPDSYDLGEDEITVLADSIGTLTAQLEKHNFAHMQELRSICDENQKKRFDAITKKMFEHGSRPKLRKKRRNKRRGE